MASVDRPQYSKFETLYISELESEENSYNYRQKPCLVETSSGNPNHLTPVDFVILASFIAFWASLAIVLNFMSPAQPLVQLESLNVTKEQRWNIELSIKNPEKRWTGHFNEITCTLVNEETVALARTGIESFSLEPGKKRGVGVKMDVPRTNHSLELRSYSIRLSIMCSFETPRSVLAVGKSFMTDYACTNLNITFGNDGRGKLVGPVPKLFNDKLPV